MNKKLLLVGLCICSLCLTAPSATAQTFDSGDISAILEDNSLRDVLTRYTSVLSYFFPEEATRLGFVAGNNKLNNRSAQADAQALQALEAIQGALNQIDMSGLSAGKQTEYVLLKEDIARHVWQLRQNRLATNPLYYAQALDSIYDLLLVPQSEGARKQRTDLLGRISALPQLVKYAQQNLTDVSPVLARVAMERSYYAYLAFDQAAKVITDGNALTNDPRDSAQAEETIQQAKKSLRQLFDLFKKLSQPQEDDILTADFRVGKEPYAAYLANIYQITQKQDRLGAQLLDRFEKDQKALFDALQLFDLSAEEEDITVVEDLNTAPQKEATAAKPTKKDQKPAYVPPTANQFYAVAAQLSPAIAVSEILPSLTKQVNTLSARLYKSGALPVTLQSNLQPLAQYFAYQQADSILPGYGTFWMRLPFGNKLAQEEMLKRYFTEPATKLFISQEILPGRYYQHRTAKSNLRRLLPNPTLQNGWSEYALELMKQQGYLITDEELLFVAWQRYTRSLAALLDYRLHTLAYDEQQAMAFLTRDNGFSTEEATVLVNAVAANPGQAVSYIVGAQMWENLAKQYAKKFKTPGQLTALLLQVGNISPTQLETEAKRIYKK